MDEFYKDKGYYIHSEEIIPAELIDNALSRIPDIYAGKYDLGFSPSRRWNLGDLHNIQKIDQVHRCDKAFLDLVTHPELYRIVSEVLNANMLQVWGTQLIIKPPCGGEKGNIGWHSDEVNWYWLSGEMFTIWVPLVDVSIKNGTIAYIPGSHNIDIDFCIEDAYLQDLKLIEDKIKRQKPDIDMNPVFSEIKAGAFSMHDKKTIHASMENESDMARISLAINVRTDKSECLYDKDDLGYLKDIDNPVFSPIVYLKENINV